MPIPIPPRPAHSPTEDATAAELQRLTTIAPHLVAEEIGRQLMAAGAVGRGRALIFAGLVVFAVVVFKGSVGWSTAALLVSLGLLQLLGWAAIDRWVPRG